MGDSMMRRLVGWWAGGLVEPVASGECVVVRDGCMAWHGMAAESGGR